MNRRRRIIIGILVAAAIGVVLTAFAGANGPNRRARGLIAPVVVIGAGAVVLVIVLAARGRRKHGGTVPTKKAVEAARFGLTYRDAAESGFHHQFGPLPGIPRGGNVKHVMTGALDGRPLTIFEHSYVINTGQAVIPVYHVAYITTAPQWPSVTISRRRLLGRLARRLGVRRGLELEDPAFNAMMKIKTDDEDFALTLVHPDMQAFLLEKRSVVWRVHAGHCALIYGGALRLDRMGASLDRLRQFWALVPPELNAW